VTFGATTLHNTGNADVFVVSYDANGQVRWAQAASGASDASVYGLAVSAAGNVFLAARLASPSSG
jgi:hypothetical protein